MIQTDYFDRRNEIKIGNDLKKHIRVLTCVASLFYLSSLIQRPIDDLNKHYLEDVYLLSLDNEQRLTCFDYGEIKLYRKSFWKWSTQLDSNSSIVDTTRFPNREYWTLFP